MSLADTLVATDDNGTINHVHTDHLGGTNITTDTTGVITQTLDYYPYGDTRIDVGTDNETKQFTGYTKDSSTGLNYAGQRYYAGNIGRFISQDPVGLALGDKDKMKEISKIELKKYLGDPQSHNVYAYARNNPVKYVDENGEWFKEYATGQQSFSDFRLEVGGAAAQMSNDSKVWKTAIDNPVAAGATVGVAGGAAFVGGASAATYASLNYLGGAGTACAINCVKIGEVADKLAKTASNVQKIKNGTSVDQLSMTARQGKELFSRISGSNVNILKNGNGLSKTIGDATVVLRNSQSGSRTLEIAKKVTNVAGKIIKKVAKNRLKG